MKDIEQQVTLTIPDINQPFKVRTDSSIKGIAGIVTQQGKLIGLFSKKLGPNQSNYSAMELELLAIVQTLENFRSILLHSEIVIYTDNHNLTFDTSANKTRAQRWKLNLMEFRYKLLYVPGESNNGPDYLSRCFVLRNSFPLFSPTIIKQAKDMERDEISVLEKNRISVNGIELPCTEDQRIIIPSSFETKFIEKVHETLAHCGINKCWNSIRKIYYIKNGYEKFSKIINTCLLCQKNKFIYKNEGLVSGFITSESPFSKLAMDFFGPLDLYEYNGSGKVSILLITDIFTRLCKVSVLRTTIAEDVVICLQDRIKRFGKLIKIISDQGKQFTSAVLKDFCDAEDIKLGFSTMYNPQGNSIVERQNQTLGNVLRIYKGRNINEVARFAERALNWGVNRSTGLSPWEIVYKRSAFDPAQRIIDINLDKIKSKVDSSAELREQERNKNRKPAKFEIGEFVLWKTPVRNKIDEVRKGPYQVLEVLSNGNNLVLQMEQRQVKVNVKQIKRAVIGEEQNVERENC